MKVTELFVAAFVWLLACIPLAGAADTWELAGYWQQQQDTIKRDTSKVRPLLLPPYLRDRYGDPFSQFVTPSPLLPRNPSNIRFNINLDSTGSFYNISETFGPFNYRTESKIPFDAYQQYKQQQMERDYWQRISSKQDGADDLPGENLAIPPIKLGRFAQRLFGGDEVTIQPNGSVVLDFGGLWQRVDNPNLPIRQQRNGGFNFDQQITMAMQGKVGEKLGVNANFDTKNTFQFEQLYNVNYTAFEEDIIQEVQVGNISFPVQNSLITGAQNLFGVSTKMRFGKLWISSVMSNQRGTTESITIKNGAQSRQFEIRGDSYEANRHFFLGHFFREQYERSLQSIPMITSGIIVTRVELYVTNRNNNTQTLRNVAAFMDLGEGRPFNQTLNPAPRPGNAASNDANRLFAALRVDPVLRNIDNTRRQVEATLNFRNGQDFEILRGARRLDEREYVLNQQLGYVSLVTPLRNDEILAVSYEYTFNGQVFKVGEMVEDYQNFNQNESIFLKLLSPSTIRIDLPIWDLMMKNIYPLQANQIARENFQLRVVYRDDLTGIDNPSLHEGIRTKDIPLVQLLGADRLNPNNDPQPDGNFDFVEGITVDSRNGRVIFPVLEPFGSALRRQFIEPDEIRLINKYVFDTLYRGTQADAALNVTFNKFFLKGSFQSGSGNEIILPGINIAPNSVVVRAGGATLNEGTDYTVDYQFGRVRIINEGVLNSGKEIRIQYERADLFSFQQRSFMGVDAEYRLTKDIKFTGTLLHLNERPLITRVSIGSEPARNTLWGFGAEYRSESRLLTKIVDKLPFLSTKETSSISFKGEFAQIIPGAPRLLGPTGTSFIDDFEQAEVPYDMTRNPSGNWVLGSTPQLILNRSPITPDNPLSYNFRRAKLAWYTIDNVFYLAGAGPRTRPANVTEEDLENNYVRLIRFDEVFPNRERGQIVTNEPSFDLAYYPDERGHYNMTTNLTPEGKLANPEQNFGAITRAITQDIDFDNINIQYIEFWMMDPFISGRNGRRITGAENNTGGQLFFNLGNVSEDLIPDDRHFFENGLPIQDTSQVATTDFGRVPTTQYLTNAFAVGPNARALQDVGFDGLSSEEEAAFFGERFIDRLPANLNPAARSNIVADPSADDFRYFLDAAFDEPGVSILDRYKSFNGMEGNSPEGTGNLNFTPASSTIPDNEDLNRDNTVSDLEQYYQYRVDLFPGMNTANNQYIVDELEGLPDPATGQRTRWYQFRIPLRGPNVENVNGINGFKSIRFFRMFMTGWRDPVVLRMVQFQLVGAQWRPFLESLTSPEPRPIPDTDRTNFIVSSVNIEENGQDSDPQRIAYNMPPGVERDFDITSNVTRRLNEQSLQLCVEGLQDGDSRAVFKNFNLDMVFYKRLKMEIHAQDPDTRSGELTAFIRLGTDFKENYYEIEVPLQITPLGTPAADREALWPRLNAIDIAIEDLIALKAQRNRQGVFRGAPFPDPNLVPGPNIGIYRVTVVGNPDLSAVQTVMLGIRNPATPDQLPKDVCVWMNELRVSDFDNTSGWATNAVLNMKLADFATVSASLRYNTFGFGAIQDKISDRSRSANLDFDISANISLDKILLGKLGISLPLFVSYERNTSNPFFNPLDPDMRLELALSTFEDEFQRNFFRNQVTELSERRSINLTNVRKVKLKEGAKTNLWDIENLAFNASYTDASMRNITTAQMEMRQWRLGAIYGYNLQAEPIEPFKDSEKLKSPWLKLVKDFNFSLKPSSIAVRGELTRDFRGVQLRNADLTTFGIPAQFEKAFVFNRGYNMNWAFTRNLGLDYKANVFAIIDEPEGRIDTDVKRDSIRNNLRNLGRMKNFNQTIGVNYRLPFDKLPATTWLSADARYAATYDWTAGAVGIADTLGNSLRNSQTISVNGKVDFNKIYNAVPFLKKINSPPRRGEKVADPLETRKGKLEKRLIKTEAKQEKQGEKRDLQRVKAQEKREALMLKQLEKGDSTLYFEIQAQPMLPADTVKRKPGRLDRRKDQILENIARIDTELNRRRAEQRVVKDQKALKGLASVLMSVKNVNVTYTENNGTMLPGFSRVPFLLGFDRAWDSPGLPYVLGSQSPEVRFQAAQRGWLATNGAQNNPFMQNSGKQLTIRANAEPVRDFKIQLEARQNNTSSYSEVFRWVPDINNFQSQTPMRNGGYSISIFTMRTAFAADDRNNNSPLFSQFVANRQIIRDRLSAANPAGEYEINSQDVLVAAFRATYEGKDANTADLTAFPRIPIPNWRVTYNGLSRVALFKDWFKSISLTHGYSSDYSIGNYASSLFYNDNPEFFGININPWDFMQPSVDTAGRIVPLLILNQVTISEQFAPLIGINLRTQNDFTIKLDYKMRRDLALNLSNSEITELRNNDLSFDFGFTKAGMKMPFRIRGGYRTLENDVNFRLAFIIRDTKTVQRRIEDAPTVTAGNINFQLKPTVSYQLNRQATLQFYFERSINDPRVSNSFKRATTAFGIQVRYALTQ